MIWLCLALCVFLLRGFSQAVQAQQPSTDLTSEVRGVWLTNVDSDILFSRDRLTQGLQRLASMNFNTVYPTVWNKGYTLYPSAAAERAIGRKIDPNPALQGRDMLAELIEEAHQQNISVIPWFEFGLKVPVKSEVVRRHPNWVTYRRNARHVAQGENGKVWLNPFHPMVQRFMVSLISEMIVKYDVDGIQIDDHLSLPVDLGYDTFTAQIYQREKGGRPPNNPNDPTWMKWRANKLTALVTQIHDAVKSRKPNALVTLSPNPHGYAYTTSLQDWRTWERRGLVDEIVLQVYRDQLNEFTTELDRPEIKAAKKRVPVSIGILTGLKNRPVPIERIKQQVQAARDRNFAGVAFFFYESLGDRDAAFQTLFPTNVARLPEKVNNATETSNIGGTGQPPTPK